MENSIEREEEILNNIKAYMQESIDRGYHKFVYIDLGYDEKCVDVINAIEHILSSYKKVLKENEEWDRKFCNLQNLYFKLQDESESKRKEWQEAYKSEKKMKNEYIKLYQDLLLKENVIPIQKIKDKIEEIQEEGYWLFTTNRDSDKCVEVLQELLEREEK